MALILRIQLAIHSAGQYTRVNREGVRVSWLNGSCENQKKEISRNGRLLPLPIEDKSLRPRKRLKISPVFSVSHLKELIEIIYIRPLEDIPFESCKRGEMQTVIQICYL